MSDPQALRDKAAHCRRLARKPRRGFPQSSGHHYLLELAERFESEAANVERRMAGSKPAAGAGEAKPRELAEGEPVDPGPLVGQSEPPERS
jgi:hypothetical protein